MKVLSKINSFITTRSKAVKISAFIVLILCCIFLCFAFLSPRSGDQLFKDLILNPMPKSVIVLDRQEEDNLDGIMCLHFKISLDDFKLILASKKWQVVPEPSFIPDCQTDEARKWWNPQLLGQVTTYSVFTQSSNTLEIMLTNSQMSDVYYYFDAQNTR